jgi:hypothetical protein
MDQRCSRIPKVKTLPTGWLITLVRTWKHNLYRWNDQMLSVVNELTERGNEEGQWLMNQVENSPIALYYTWHHNIEYLQQSANAGFAPAMTKLYQITRERHWLDKALLHQEPLALTYNGYFYKAAELGCIRAVADILADDDDPPNMRLLQAQHVFLSGGMWPVVHMERCKWTLLCYYTLGRTLEGFYDIWGKPLDDRCTINLYLTVSHRARQAALQTVSALRQMLGRDVAQLIGKLVYSTRETDVDSWWS